MSRDIPSELLQVTHYSVDHTGKVVVHHETAAIPPAPPPGAEPPEDMKHIRQDGLIQTYILDATGNPVLEGNPERFRQWFEHLENRIIRRTDLPGGVSVATMFLGFDQRVMGNGLPVLWETVVFGSKREHLPRATYTSKNAAIEGHDAAVELIKRLS